MYKTIIGATTCLITIVATYATLVAIPETYAYRIHLLILFLLLLLGYLIALIIWVGERINLKSAWQLLLVSKEKGINRIFADGQQGTTIGKPFVAKSRNIRIMQTTGIGLTKQLKEEIILALEHPNTRIHVLIASGDGDFIKELEQVEGHSRIGHIITELPSVEGVLQECVDEAKIKFRDNKDNDIGKVFLGHFNTQFRLSLLICDNDWCWMTLILPPKRAPLSVSLELVRSKNPLIDDCLNHFDKVWASVSIKELF